MYRFYSGIGIPYKNFSVLPFEKSFFSGGANGMRGWRLRKLGPGSYFDPDANIIDHIGNIQMEANLEYRFDLLKIVEGAAFVDAGNIWLLEKDNNRPNAAFRTNEFMNEIAVSAGVGLRFDLNFFIIRTDIGIPIKDPILPKGERWMFQNKNAHNGILNNLGYGNYKILPVLNFGIGYPF